MVNITGTSKPITEPLIASIVAAAKELQTMAVTAASDIDTAQADILALQANDTARTGVVNIAAVGTYTASTPFNLYVGNLGSFLTLDITLPTILDTVPFVPYNIKDINGSAATKNIIVHAASGETIEGAGTSTISTNYGSLKLRPINASTWGKF